MARQFPLQRLGRLGQTASPAALLVLLSVTAGPLPTGAAGDRPNVVIFLTDDQGTLDANGFGSPDLHTPAIDRLAAEGVRFTQAYAHTVCCPARALLLTGRHPQRSGIVNWTQGSRKAGEGNPGGTNLPREEVTLAEVFKAAGYRTALFGKWHLGARAGHGPLDQGFERFFGHLGGFIDNYNHHFLHGRGFHDLYDQREEVFERGAYFPDLMTGKAIEWIGEGDRTGPFFLYFALNIPHYPEQAGAEFEERYRELPMPRRSYARMVSTTDARIGRVLGALDRSGRSENTVVLFMSDNGHSAEDGARIRGNNHKSGFPEGHYYHAHGGGGNTGKWRGHKGQYFEGGIRVPAIISFPGRLPRGEVRDQAVTAADWFPTLLQLCGISIPSGITLDGRSLLPLIEDATAPSPHKTLHWAWGRGWAVREGDWKLIGNRDRAIQLVNLTGDRPERVNHLKARPDLATRLHGLHRSWMAETSGSGD